MDAILLLPEFLPESTLLERNRGSVRCLCNILVKLSATLGRVGGLAEPQTKPRLAPWSGERLAPWSNTLLLDKDTRMILLIVHYPYHPISVHHESIC